MQQRERGGRQNKNKSGSKPRKEFGGEAKNNHESEIEDANNHELEIEDAKQS